MKELTCWNSESLPLRGQGTTVGMEMEKKIKIHSLHKFHYTCSCPESKELASTFETSQNRSPFPDHLISITN